MAGRLISQATGVTTAPTVSQGQSSSIQISITPPVPTGSLSVTPVPTIGIPTPLVSVSVTPTPDVTVNPNQPTSSTPTDAPPSSSETQATVIPTTPTPTPTPVPLNKVIQNTYNAIRDPLSYLLQQTNGSFQYGGTVMSYRTSATLLFFSVLLLIISFLVLNFMKNSIGKYWYLFFIPAVLIIAGVLYFNSAYRNATRNYSSYTLLTSSWDKYKGRFIKPDGRVTDEKNITTSEAQSYALLQSVIADDKQTFDRVWIWTTKHLNRGSDALFGWRYGQVKKSAYGFLPDGGSNSASDADSDIALSLILGYRRWHVPAYRASALKILDSMWTVEVATASGKMYLTAGNWAQSPTEIVVNPSYFAPYAWRIFAEEDKSHDWKSLIDPAYKLLTDSGRANLNTGKAVGLPPDWLSLNKDTGDINPTNLPNLNTDYSFDAMRIPWRVALDYTENRDPQALSYLRTLGFLIDSYRKEHTLAEAYAHDGRVISNVENPVMYATALGMFMYVRQDIGNTVYQDKILNLYSTDANAFRQDLSYYEENWLWFGSALYLNAIYKF